MNQNRNNQEDNITKNINLGTQKAAEAYGHLGEQTKGYILVIFGALLLFYSLGYFQMLNLVVLLGAVGLIIYGGLKSHLFEKIKNLVVDLKNKFSK